MDKSQKIKKDVATRLNKLLAEAGFRTNREFSQAMSAAGFKITPSAISELLAGATSPKTENWIGIKRVLEKKMGKKISLDWLIAGEEPTPESTEVKKALEVLEKLKTNANNLPDSELSRISKRFLGLPEELRTAVEQLIEQMEVLAKEKTIRK